MRWRLVDRLLECEPGRSAVAVKRFDPEEPLFRDHFPGRPTVPGVLLIEMIAATGGMTVWLDDRKRAVLAMVKAAKFHRRVEPGEQCLISVEITQRSHGRAAAEGTVEVAGERAARATVIYGVNPDPPIMASDPVAEQWLARRKTPRPPAENLDPPPRPPAENGEKGSRS